MAPGKKDKAKGGAGAQAGGATKVEAPASIVDSLPPALRRPALQAIYYGKLSGLVCFFLFGVLPLSTTVGVLYGIITLLRTKFLGKDPGRYIDELNLIKSGISPLQQFLVLNRSPMVLAIVLPISRFYQMYGHMRTAHMQAMDSAPSLHAQRVEHVQRQFKQWKDEGGDRRIVTARPGWQRVSNKQSAYKQGCFRMQVDRMIDILDIDLQERFVRVEPMVTMGVLVPVLMKNGWTLPVVPELEELTVGGMIAGTGVESSSHHSGLFQEFCIELEIALSSGQVVTCSRKERPDLFEGFFWSYGTLGMLMSAKLRIIPCQSYVRLVYHPFSTEQSFVDFWRAESLKGVRFAERDGDDVNLDEGNKAGDSHCSRFVEGLVFAKDAGVVMLGDFVDRPGADGAVYEHAKWYKPYFYRHAQHVMERATQEGAPIVEYLPTRDYYYRHSRSVFWEMENIVPLGESAIFRWCFGWMLPPSVSFLKLTTPAELQKFYDSKHVIQDMLVPADTMEKSLAVFRKEFDMYPLWVCPMCVRPGRGLVHARGDKVELFVDLGAYGVPGAVRRAEDYDVVERLRAVEEYVTSVQGFEMLYADSFMTRTEFGKMFDRKMYDDLRQRLGADKAFPDIYDKIVEPRRLEQLRERLGEEACK